MKRERLIAATMFLALLSFVSCNDDDDGDVYPSLISDFACIQTNSAGGFANLILDDGTSYTISNAHEYTSPWAADSLYRVVCRYLPQTSGAPQAHLYAVSRALAPKPKVLPEDEPLIQHPVGLQSIWRSGDYINIILDILALNQTHYFSFIEMPSSGPHKIEIVLYHDRGEDVEGYTQKAYCSLPLSQYKEKMESGDTIALSISTYEGEKVYRFLWSSEIRGNE